MSVNLNLFASPVSTEEERIAQELQRQRMAAPGAGNVTPQDGLLNNLGFTPQQNPSIFPYEGATDSRLQSPLLPTEANFFRAREEEMRAQARPLAERNLPPEPTFMSRLGSAIGDRFRDPAWRARMAAATNNMTLNPNAAFQQAMMDRSQNILQSRQAATDLQRTGNATVEYLRAQGQNELAELVKQQPRLGADVIAYMLRDPKNAPAELQLYAMWQQQNPNGTLQEFIELRKAGGTTIFTGEPGKQLTQSYTAFFDSARDSRQMNNTLDFVKQIGAGTAVGPLESQRNAVRRFASAIGIPVDEEKMASADMLQGYTNQLVASELRMNKGPQTDYDNQFAQTYLPNIRDSRKAFDAKIDYYRSRNLWNILIGDYANSVYSTGQRPEEDAQNMQRLRSLEFNLPAVTPVTNDQGQVEYVTLAQFYDEHSANKTSREILEGWAEVTGVRL